MKPLPLRPQADRTSIFELEQHLPYLLVRNANKIGSITQNRYQNTTPDGDKLSLREFRTLLIVAVRGVVSPASVADATGMDRSTVTRALATLRDKGLLTERSNADDKRAKLLQLTDNGQILCGEIFPEMEAYDSLVRAEFTQVEITQFTEMLDKLMILFSKK